MKIAILFYRLGPYHHARLRTLAGRAQILGIALFASDRYYEWKRNAADGWPPCAALFADESTPRASREMRRRVFRTLDEERPEVVAIAGWGERGMLCALAWCLARRVPAVVMSDSYALVTKRSKWREWVKGHIVRCFSSALCAGAPQMDYLKSLGIPPEAVFPGFDVVDNGHFTRGSLAARLLGCELRSQLQLPRDYFIVVGRLSPEKNLERLLQAYAEYFRECGDCSWHLVLVGSGPLHERLAAQVKRLRLEHRVFLRGFAQYNELPIYYGLSRGLILPSLHETWGLVVNEAMAAGVPVLVSNRCGCVPDLIREESNGFSFDPVDTRSLAGAMMRLSDPRCDSQAMGAAGQEAIGQWPLELFGAGLLKAAALALQRGPRRPTLVARCALA